MGDYTYDSDGPRGPDDFLLYAADIQKRYGWSDMTLRRRIKAGRFLTPRRDPPDEPGGDRCWWWSDVREFEETSTLAPGRKPHGHRPRCQKPPDDDPDDKVPRRKR